MRQKLDSTNLLLQDLADQPQDTKYVLFLAGILGEKGALAVDRIEVYDTVVEAWRGTPSDEVLLACWNPDLPWALVERARLEFFSGREWAKRLAQDTKDFKDLIAQLDPGGETTAGTPSSEGLWGAVGDQGATVPTGGRGPGGYL